ncbi:MAG: TonB-dependent receptor [Proteobacteria bacterium]|nr:TonB-dependent receptor [Pseudomonadota bacterium]
MGSIGPAASQPVASVRGDRTQTNVEVDQLRFVGGVKGDLPFLTVGSLDNWSFELSASYSKSTGESSRVGIRDDRLDLSLGWFSSTNTPCENDLGVVLEPDVAPGCVPVDMFAPSLYEGVVGDFATAAERNYLFDSRDFDTEYEQTIISYYMTGDIFELPAGSVAFGFGFETRDDEIRSLPDAVARDGLFFGFFSDGGAVGEKTTNEAFAEIELPLLAGEPAFEELTLNLSTRYTDDELFGSDVTESIKLGWRPVESLLIRGTFGTSFRAPNLRELFLASQSGFLNLFDPCLIPNDALDPMGNYVPSLDTREPEIFANCLANGVDATVAQNAGFNTYSIEVPRGGSLTLDAEKSESWSAGFAWDQPFTNAFDLAISATYYQIDVKNTIIEPGGQFVINDCYNSLTGNSAFCSRISRDFSDPTRPLMDNIDLGFLNRDKETARGVDINVAYDDTFTFFERPIDLSIDIRANRQLERSTLFIDDEGNVDFDTFQGEFGFPSWTIQGFFRLEYDDYRITWETRYKAGVEQDARGIDSFDDVFGNSDTCLGPPNDVLCRDIGFADNYFTHNVSLYYYGDRWTIGGGIRNLLDEEPPIVDGTEVLAVNNTPIGYGYDLNGRVYFFNIVATFGGGE